MAVDAGTVIRASSAAMFLLVGVALAWLGRGRKENLALAALLGFVGAEIVANNLLRQRTDDVVMLKGVLLVPAAFAALACAALAFRPAGRRVDGALATGLAVGTLYLALLFGTGVDAVDSISGATEASPGVRAFSRVAAGATFFGLATLLTTASVRVAVDPPRDRPGWLRATGVVASVGVWWTVQTPTVTLAPFAGWSLAATIVVVAAVAVPWLVAAARTGERFPLAVAMTSPALGCFAYAYVALNPGGPEVFYDGWGVLGIARLVGWAIFVHAILKADLLGVPLPRLAVNRGAVAAGALATLFIVAQVAQNFFSAEYGLLTGGVVAGAFLFMAQPMQRVAERFAFGAAAGRTPRATPARAADDDGTEAVYRDALRIAFRDGRVSREEELHLAELGERLGIPARRALALRHEVESERRGAA